MNLLRYSLSRVFFICFLSYTYAQNINNSEIKTSILFIQTFHEVKKPIPAFLINSNYVEAHYGFICKKELQLEKQTKLPLKIRVGSLSDCDYLEGKQWQYIFIK